MTAKINFILAFHIHQPVGNFEHILMHATKTSYKPLFTKLYEHPNIKFVLHISGPVWEYFQEKQPELIEKIALMVSRGQCELMGGGFYEPILTVIPSEDALAQINLANDFFEKEFGIKPSGIWLAERVWEPNLPSILAKAGVKYTMIDDYHLKSVGIIGKELFGYFTTDDRGNTITIFPINEKLRYTMPFSRVEETIEYLRNIADESGENLIISADDGEKYGFWPKTYKWVWKQGWMEKFLTALENNSSWIKTTTPSEALKNLPPKGRVYLPTCSYFEMSEWTLPPRLAREFHKLIEELKAQNKFDEMQPFLKGGFWRNFLAKYHESNWMHKRMIWVSSLLRKYSKEGHLVSNARRALFKSQCNCAYWHGVFGGLYLPHLRRAVWKNLIEAEDEIRKKAKLSPIIKNDLDADMREEIRLSTNKLSIWVAPHRGGVIEEITFYPAKLNLVDTLSRREESYHDMLLRAEQSPTSKKHPTIYHNISAKEKGLTQRIIYDWYIRRFAHEHFIERNINASEFEKLQYNELGDFVDGEFKLVAERHSKNYAMLILRRDGNILKESSRLPVEMIKVIEIADNTLSIAYEMEGDCEPTKVTFALETHFALHSSGSERIKVKFPENSPKEYTAGRHLTIPNVNEFEIKDELYRFTIHAKTPSDRLFMFPIKTISKSEGGFERLYQETAFVHVNDFVLSRGKKINIIFEWKFESI